MKEVAWAIHKFESQPNAPRPSWTEALFALAVQTPERAYDGREVRNLLSIQSQPECIKGFNIQEGGFELMLDSSLRIRNPVA